MLIFDNSSVLIVSKFPVGISVRETLHSFNETTLVTCKPVILCPAGDLSTSHPKTDTTVQCFRFTVTSSSSLTAYSWKYELKLLYIYFIKSASKHPSIRCRMVFHFRQLYIKFVANSKHPSH